MNRKNADYGKPAPTWAQMYPRLIRVWAWFRVLGWMIRGHGV